MLTSLCFLTLESDKTQAVYTGQWVWSNREIFSWPFLYKSNGLLHCYHGGIQWDAQKGYCALQVSKHSSYTGHGIAFWVLTTVSLTGSSRVLNSSSSSSALGAPGTVMSPSNDTSFSCNNTQSVLWYNQSSVITNESFTPLKRSRVNFIFD